ncbi:MAG: Crp/Fnr family transcriptional regulator [Tagaea sp.]
MSAGLGAIPFFRGADKALLKRFDARAKPANYEAGQIVVDFDEVSDDVFFLLTGGVCVVVRAPSGKETILGDIVAGAFVGEMSAIDARPRSACVTALHRTRLIRLRGADFMALTTASPVLAARLLRVLSVRVRALNERLLEHSSLGVRGRLYAELLRQARPRADGGPPVISPPPVQHVLAARIGARREAVSREIARLVRAGILVRARGTLSIVRADTLRAAIATELGA